MKIILQPTSNENQHSVTLETPHDDINIEEAIELVKGALVAWGYHPDIVNEYALRNDSE